MTEDRPIQGQETDLPGLHAIRGMVEQIDQLIQSEKLDMTTDEGRSWISIRKHLDSMNKNANDFAGAMLAAAIVMAMNPALAMSVNKATLGMVKLLHPEVEAEITTPYTPSKVVH